MNKLSDDRAFRAQLVAPGQVQIYDYWLSCCADGQLPCRSDIKPVSIPRLLPNISLVDVAAPVESSRVRLAGTKLREIYDREITGLAISELDWGEKAQYWIAAFHRTVSEGKPTQGVVRGPRKSKDHVVQYWLRLPLRVDGSSIRMVLCYDHFVSVTDTLARTRLASSA